MSNNHIATTDRRGLTVSQVAGSQVYKMFPQIIEFLKANRFGNEYLNLFAEPVENDRSIDWYTDIDKKPVCFKKLPDEKQRDLLVKFNELSSGIQAFTERLRQTGAHYSSKGYADILEKALSYPNIEENLYSIGGMPVLTCWGFAQSNNELVSDVQSLIKTIEEKLKKKEEELKPAPVLPPQDNNKSLAEKEGLQPEQIKKKTPPPTPVPVQDETALPPKKKSSALPILLGILALLLIAGALAWYFLFYKKSSIPLDFLTGDINFRAALVNEANESVDLRFNFPSNDGKGQLIISESSQTCEGSVNAHASDEKLVFFETQETICPNGNHYEPMVIKCVRHEASCTGTTKSGQSWHLNINIDSEDIR